jgi:hypothetical protein
LIATLLLLFLPLIPHSLPREKAPQTIPKMGGLRLRLWGFLSYFCSRRNAVRFGLQGRKIKKKTNAGLVVFTYLLSYLGLLRERLFGDLHAAFGRI